MDEPTEHDDEQAWHDVCGMLARAVESHASALTELRIAAGIEPDEAYASVQRFGMRLASQVSKAASNGARQALRWHAEGPPDG